MRELPRVSVVDVVYIDDVKTTTTEWLTTHYDACELAKSDLGR